MNENIEDVPIATSLGEVMDALRERYVEQYDVRLVPSVRLGNTLEDHHCKCTIRVRHGSFTGVSESSYLEAAQDALRQVLEASPT